MRIAIVASSGHARVVADIIENQGLHQIVGFLDDNKDVGTPIGDYLVIGKSFDIATAGVEGAIVAIGDNAIRAKLARRIGEVAPEVRFVSAIHPKACVAKSADIGSGVVVMANAVINPHCVVGNHCIINTGAILEHDGIMLDFSSLAPGVVTGGNCRVGRFSAISLGAKIKHNINIGNDTVIGAASLIIQDVPSNSVCYGVPGRVVRQREHGDKYL